MSINPRFEDIRQSDKWAEYMKAIGWEVEEVGKDRVKAYIKRLPIIGSVIKIQRPLVMPSLGEIDSLARKHHAFLVKIEPSFSSPKYLNTYIPRYFRPDSWPLLPTKELWLDLRPSEAEIFRSFSESARRILKKSQEFRVKSLEFDEENFNHHLKYFWLLLRETGKRRGFFVEPFEYLRSKVKAFGGSGFLVLASATSASDAVVSMQQLVPDRLPVVVKDSKTCGEYHLENRLTSGLFVLIHDRVAYYHFSATSEEGSKVNVPYLILWGAIKEAKRRGCQTFNLEGVYDPRFPKFTKNWQGFSEFKSRFGGEIIDYPGSFSRWYFMGYHLTFL